MGSDVAPTSLFFVETWLGIIEIPTICFPSLPPVGYEHGEDLEAVLASGFTEIGFGPNSTHPSRWSALW